MAIVPSFDQLVERLTEGERDVLDALATGAAEKEVAHQLGLSRQEVNRRLQRAVRLTGALTTGRLAYLWGKYRGGQMAASG
jgi:FixJ family two-component response regulator